MAIVTTHGQMLLNIVQSSLKTGCGHRHVLFTASILNTQAKDDALAALDGNGEMFGFDDLDPDDNDSSFTIYTDANSCVGCAGDPINKQMKAATPYIHLHQRKRTWTPVGLQRYVASWWRRRHQTCSCYLRSPIGDFINEAMRGDLPDEPGCKKLLQSNVIDEEKHDIALVAAAARKIPDRFEAETERIKNAWLELDRRPVLKAVVLERSVFFVLLPIFRFLGDTGLRTTSADISHDEQTTCS